MSQLGGPVLITGAGGFIGRDLVARLLARGSRVRVMLRPGSPVPFAPHDRLEVARAEMRDEAALVSAVTGCAAVVHLAAAMADEKDSEDINVGGARKLVQACRRGGCRRLINISTQSTKIARKGAYGRTKSEADAVFRASGLDVTSLLPSVVYGEDMGGVFGTIVRFVRKAPVIPVLGNGKWISAPVYIGDVAAAVIACIERPVSIGRDYDIGGPTLVQFDEIIDRIAAAMGRRPRKVHVPFGLALWIARMVAHLPKPPITVSNVLGSNQDTHIDIEPPRRDLGFEPRSLEEGLRLIAGALRHDVARSMSADEGRSDVAAWAVECSVLSRYLIGHEPAPELVERYRAAVGLKLAGLDLDDADWRWARRHPRCIPYLDAAAGLMNRRRSALRARLYLLAALLEATPAHADHFLPRASSATRVLALLSWHAMRSGLNAIIGMPLLAWARRFG